MVEHLFGMEAMKVRFFLRAPDNAKIAQLVEHRSEESGVVGSIPTLGTKFCKCQQEKDSLGRFFEGQPSVKVGRVRVP